MDYFKKFRARGSALEVTITTHKTNPSLVPYGMPPLSGGLEVKSPFFRATCSLSALLKKISSCAAIISLQKLATCLAKQITKL